MSSGGQNGDSEANLNDGEGGWMRAGSLGLLPLRGGVSTILSSTIACDAHARDEGDHGATPSEDAGAEATWVAPAVMGAGPGGTRERL
jgi:hypothetical protein